MLTFDEEKHEYRFNGEVIPGVSTLCDLILGKPYKDVPKHILENAADFGTNVHLAIEYYNEYGLKKNLPPAQEHCLNEWISLKEKHKVQIIESEKIVHYNGLFAGTLDARAIFKNKRYIIDYKTSAAMNNERYSLQSSLYRLCEGWDSVDGILIAWLPKRSYGQLIELPSWEYETLIESLNGVFHRNILTN